MIPPSVRSGALSRHDGLLDNDDRIRIDAELASFLARSGRKFASNPHVEPVYELMGEFVLQGGKRVRPRLCLAAYRILSGQEPERPTVLAASCLELFHAFMLVHDDLIDSSLTRRDQPTLHEAIRQHSDNPADSRTASDLALLAGDWLFALGLRLIARSGLDDAIQGRAQRFLADMLFETGIGEGLDVLYGNSPLNQLNESQIIEAYLRKTSRYSVSGPLILSAILAGAQPAVCRSLGRYGDRLGLCYQIRNDLEALPIDPHEPCDDLDSGKRTLLLWTAYRHLDPAGRQTLEAALELHAGPDRRRILLDLIHGSRAVEHCLARITSYQREAARALQVSPLDDRQRRVLAGLVRWITAGAAHSGARSQQADPAAAVMPS